MTYYRGRLKFNDIRQRVLEMIPYNHVSPLNPYLILVRAAGTNVEYVKLLVYESDGITVPRQARYSKIVWSMNAYVGVTRGSSIYTRLPLAIEARNFFNMLHCIKHKRQRVTPELMSSITTPELKQKLIEACCLAAL
jgi:hypothetical protein